MTSPIENRPHVVRSQVAGQNRAHDARAESLGSSAEAQSAKRLDASLQSDRLQAVSDALERTPEIDSKRVADIRERIARGEYPLNVERIAERFTALEKLLHG